jgi:preprotein translocase subunit SecD
VLKLSSWKIWGIGLLGLFGAAFAVWNFLPNTASAISQDRTGGVELVLEADVRDAAEAGPGDAFGQRMAATRDVIARRIEALGPFEPRITVQGANRIHVQVPGLHNPEALKRLVGRSARLQFKLLEVDQLPCNTPPRPGIQYLPADELQAGMCMGVQRRTLLGDENIADARQEFNENGEVSITVRFDTRGGQRFAQVTQANVGRRFAIILDNRVISAPSIREPILGGSASIAGSFTVESANQLAIQLRSGRLPVALRVVEERVIGPNTRPSGAQAAK